jgi:anthranilate/para-aminobenzoate synthase component I
MWNRASGHPELVTTDADAATGRRRLESWQRRIEAEMSGSTNALPGGSGAEPQRSEGRMKHLPLNTPLVTDLVVPDRVQAGDHVRQILEWIQAGVMFQACYTFPILCRPLVPLPQLYLALRQQQGGDFGTYLRLGRAELASVSPERLCQVSQGWVRTRPMKGTRRRVSEDGAADARAADELRQSAKDRAENVMIVDLLRNDLGRVCEPRSVCVTELFAIESYATVHQMTSTVSGRLRAGVGPFGLLAAAFPPGSMTGAPKVEACNRLSALESRPRGLYAGTVAWLGFDGEWVFSVVIRALQNDVYSDEPAGSGVCSWWVGGGIVADSDPDAEWDEAMSKAAPLLALCAGATD